MASGGAHSLIFPQAAKGRCLAGGVDVAAADWQQDTSGCKPHFHDVGGLPNRYDDDARPGHVKKLKKLDRAHSANHTRQWLSPNIDPVGEAFSANPALSAFLIISDLLGGVKWQTRDMVRENYHPKGGSLQNKQPLRQGVVG